MRAVPSLLCLLAAAFATAFESASGNFSIEPPTGWTANPPGAMGLKEPILLAPEATQGFRCNMVFVEEPMGAGDSLEVAAKGSVKSMAKVFRRFRLVSQSSLRTASGLEVAKITYEAELRPDRPLMLNSCYLVVVRNRSLLSITVAGIEPTPKAQLEQAEAAVLTLRSN